MLHSRLTRIIDLDGMRYIGGYDTFKSDEWRVYFLGHMRFFYRRQIVDMFEFENDKWQRVTGTPNIYDIYLEAGGVCWPEEFERLWSSEYPESILQNCPEQRRELDALQYAKSIN